MIENVKKPTFTIIFLIKKYCKKKTLLLWLNRIEYKRYSNTQKHDWIVRVSVPKSDKRGGFGTVPKSDTEIKENQNDRI